ncbi:PadR family transcriptional regulator [Rhodococcus oryzae]|uniref:PadR family transcriptional regulator n=1 Tax=Rhodococcus oryzae TaxID=2571143 RepID=UPI00378C884A
MARTRAFSRGNPLALAILGLVSERPMHPYQMSQTLKDRGKDDSVKLNYGSLYSVVESLAKQGMIEPVGTERDGNRPPRTVYGITDSGAAEVEAWMRELLSSPTKEYTQFLAALSFMPLLSPDVSVQLLRQRLARLDDRIGQLDATIAATASFLPELFVVENQYELALLRAERDYVASLAARIADGSLGGVRGWRSLHVRLAKGPIPPDELDAIFRSEGVPPPQH